MSIIGYVKYRHSLRTCRLHHLLYKMTRYRSYRSVIVVVVTLSFMMYYFSASSVDWITGKYYDHRGYLMTRRQENKFNLHEIAKNLRLPQKRNVSNFLSVKRELFKFVDPQTIIITKQNMKLGEEVGIYFEQDFKITIDNEFYQLLPDALPLKKTYATCSLVGSSGILSGSHCGHRIDSSEFVIRMNAPPLRNYSTDVGMKANLTTLNPSIVARRYFYLVRKKDELNFLNHMREFQTYLYIPVFSTPKGFDISVNVAKTFKKTDGYPIKPLFMHPDHFLSSSRFWKSRGITADRISSGLYMVSVALTMCDELRLFGFWPFHYDHNNITVNYHYYGQGFVPLPIVHHFAEEFKELLHLHNQGVLSMHVGKCDA